MLSLSGALAPADTNSPYCTALDAKKGEARTGKKGKGGRLVWKKKGRENEIQYTGRKGERGEGSKDGNEVSEERGGYKVTSCLP